MGRFFVSVTLANTAETLARECAGPVIAGRSEECDVHLAHPLVSRRHASIDLQADGSYIVTDLGSRNGTVVDGASLESASAPASNGSLIQIGPFTLRLAASGTGAEETVQAPRMVAVKRVTVERDLRQLVVDGQAAVERLSRHEFQFIDALVRASPNVVLSDSVGDAIWGRGQWDTYMLHNLVRRIRRKLDDHGIGGDLIENIPGSGYRIV